MQKQAKLSLNYYQMSALTVPLHIRYIKCVKRKPVFGVSTKRTVHSQKMGRGLKFWIHKIDIERVFYLCSENKGHGAADLPLCFG